ncbi:MAG: hypothetical protein CENE_03440 [Candidatus Celerinatantimonas neptuna]|nr:MAG: hypothetical protein CENE_03440 [Candidatus Celerinatantimonas neptuna]
MYQFEGELTFGRLRQKFEVPQGCQQINIAGTTVEKGFLYLLVFDASNHLRANILLEKPVKTVHLTIDDASLGGIPGQLSYGNWHYELVNLAGEFRTPKPMRYQLCIGFNVEPFSASGGAIRNVGSDQLIHFDYRKILCRQSRWYRGDLHAHTCLSDGQNNLEQALEIAKLQQLDYLFLTEHNLCHPHLPDDSSCLFLPAIEITTDLGHCNIHGPFRALNMSVGELSGEHLLQDGLDIVKVQGNLSINHPMMKPWHWCYDDMPLQAISTMEICCDPTWPTSPQASEMALKILNHAWNCGHRITAVGGSDSHLRPDQRNPKANEPSIYGDPATYIWADELSGSALIHGLTAGHVYFERTSGLQFAIQQNILPGTDVGGQCIEFQLSLSDLKQNYYAQWVADGELLEEVSLSEQPVSVSIDMALYAWVRVDIRRQGGELEGVINPIFNGALGYFSHPLVQTWGELMNYVDQH